VVGEDINDAENYDENDVNKEESENYDVDFDWLQDIVLQMELRMQIRYFPSVVSGH
jgi:hypothetical protein